LQHPVRHGSQDYLVSTPCHSFTGPQGWVNHQKPAYIEDCLTNLELWGDLEEDGSIIFTGKVGTVFANETVHPNYPNSLRAIPSDAQSVTFAGQPAHRWTDALVGGNGPGTTVYLVVDLPSQESNYWGRFSSLTIDASALTDVGNPDQMMDELETTWVWN
jgi:hypothetical protein